MTAIPWLRVGWTAQDVRTRRSTGDRLLSFDADTDELSLLAACIDGERRALDAFVSRYSRLVWFHVNNTLRRLRGRLDTERTDDLYQQVFVTLLEDDRRRLRLYRPDKGCSVASWIRIITIRTVINILRRDRHTVSLDDASRPIAVADEGIDPFTALTAGGDQRWEALLPALAEKLSGSDRLLLELIYTRRLDAAGIAAALQIKRSQVYVRKNRLIRRLRRHAEAAGLLTDGSDDGSPA